MTSKDSRHPHYDVIVKWAGNPTENKVQFRTSPDREWLDVHSSVENMSGMFLPNYFYRIKPKTVKYKYRKALMGKLSGNLSVLMVSETLMESHIENSPGFIRWLTDWIEEEIEVEV